MGKLGAHNKSERIVKLKDIAKMKTSQTAVINHLFDKSKSD